MEVNKILSKTNMLTLYVADKISWMPHYSLHGLVRVLLQLSLPLPLDDLREAALDRRVEEVVERVAEEEVEEGVEGAALHEARVHRLVVGGQQGGDQLGDAWKTKHHYTFV